MGRALDDSLVILDLTDPGWATRLTSSNGRRRPPLTDFHCHLSLAWIGAAFGVAFEAGLPTHTHVGRSSDGTDLQLITASVESFMTFAPLPEDYPRAPVNPHLPVAEQREYVTGWLASTTEWADLLLQIADRQDFTWEDMTLLADGPGATGALVHLWTARRALVDLAHHLGIPDTDMTPFPPRARVIRLRYASGAHLDDREDRPGHGDLRHRTATAGNPTSTGPSPEAAALREQRLSLGLTQTEIARRMGSAPGQVSQVEGGKIALTDAFARRYRDALGIDNPIPPASSPSSPTVSASNHGHQHTWAPFPDTPETLPLLIRCGNCGLSHLLAQPQTTNTVDQDHHHTWTVLYDARTEPALVICDCGTHARTQPTP